MECLIGQTVLTRLLLEPAGEIFGIREPTSQSQRSPVADSFKSCPLLSHILKTRALQPRMRRLVHEDDRKRY